MAQGFVGAAHDEDHSVASHDDTTATGAELEALTDGSDADALHTHSADGIDTSAIHDNESAEISVVTEKVSPIGADVLLIEDSAAGNVKKRVQITNLPGGADADAIHDNVASEISAITAKATPVSGDFLIIEDSAAANVKKSMTVAALEAVISHDSIADVSVDDHHAESHNVASHSDTTATGTELETLTDGSNADILHVHTETEFVVFGETGDLEVKSGTHRFYLPYDVTIIEVEISVGTAPTGAAAIVDVNVNGTTIFTTPSNRPEIAISGFVDSATTIEDDGHTDGQYLTVDIDQIGSTIAGADLTVVIRYEKV